MKVQVHLPGPLLPYADGQGAVALEVEGGTVQDVLQALWSRHPRLRDRMVDEKGRVRRHVQVFVERESIRYTGGLDTPIGEGATISVIPAISGG